MAFYERYSGGHVAERVRPVPGSDDEKLYAELVAKGEGGWRPVGGDEPPADPPADPPEDNAPKPPAKSAHKADWVAWADSQDPGDHESMTKDQLIEQYGKGED